MVVSDEDEDVIKPAAATASSSRAMSRSRSETSNLSRATSMDRAVSSIFVLGQTSSRTSEDRSRLSRTASLASLSYEELGGVEYSALRVLLKVVAGESRSCVCQVQDPNTPRILHRSSPSRYPFLVTMDLVRQSEVQGISRVSRPRQHMVVSRDDIIPNDVGRR